MRMATPLDFQSVTAVLEEAGLAVRGGFHPEAEDAVPMLSSGAWASGAQASGARAATLVFAGNVGSRMWQTFTADHPVESADNEAHPTLLDDWSRKTLAEVADALGGPTRCEALFPFEGPPFLPFIRWAQRAEPVFPSPIGPLIHPDHGLWHAYRGALIFAERIELPARPDWSSPCETCEDKPCLTGCPVQAHKENAFDLATCLGHVVTDAGAGCMADGCLARRACPVGRTTQYTADHARFHMMAFRRTNRAVLD